MSDQKVCQDYSPKGWSNVAGYGHIVQATIQPNGGVAANAYPWNRLETMPEPSNTLVNKSSAWSPPISATLQQQMNESCNICKTSEPTKAKYQGLESKEYSPLV